METHIAFTGSDYLLMLNGVVYDELFSFRFDSIAKRIEMDVVLFYNISSIDARLREITDGDIVEIFSNEYSQKLYKRYFGVKYTGQRSNHSADDMSITKTFIFEYESDIPLQPLEGSLKNFIDIEKLRHKMSRITI